MYSTDGHPGRWNDKIIQQFDLLISGIQSAGKLFEDFEFTLYYDYDDKGEVIHIKYKGGWLIVDNGYLKWPTCIPSPMKAALTTPEECWSQWVELIRKNIECILGILKKRWRVYKHPI